MTRRALPTTINVNFWRIACWSAMGLPHGDTDLAKSPFFAHQQVRTQSAVSQFVRRTKDEEGLAVLKILVDGAPNKWWDYWEDKILTLVLAFNKFQEARSALEPEPCP